MYNENELNLIILCSFEELTYKQRAQILSLSGNGIHDFTKFGHTLIKSVPRGVYNIVREKFSNLKYRKSVLSGLEKRGVTCVTLFSDGYPEALKNTPFPPHVLYCKGNTKLFKTRCFSVVGSRISAANALTACRKISKELTSRFTVVTGSADGADSAAMEGALDSGKLICVLAYGFDYCYPAYNERLIRKASERGLLISEYPPQTSPKAYLFPVRNRIIAGLSEGTLVVSAGRKSGALITADYAAEYGRYVFAFPYGLGVSSGEGCNSLIKKGGLLTENILDIFSAFGLDFKEPEKEPLSDAEKQLLAIIGEVGEAFVGDIAAKLNKMPYQLISILSALEIKGLIVRLGGNRYAVV